MKKILFGLLFLCSFVQAADKITWRPWTDDIFKIAQKDKRLVILDLEAVWCHWCHVMEEKTYSDPKVIELINKKYLAVRVDQDARPDLSRRYEKYGWPATIVFDWNGKELAKRSGYMPPDVMASLLQAFIDDPSPGPSVVAEPALVAAESPFLPKGLKDEMRARYGAAWDKDKGGWGFIHKYIQADTLELALKGAIAKDKEDLRKVKVTLDLGFKLLDPAWGGFYQYSTGGDWKEPHFEKILSIQTDNMRLYAQAYALTNNKKYLKASTEVYRYLTSFLTSPEGTFYTSQDADLVQGEHSEAFFKLNDAKRRKQGIPKVDTHVYAQENGWVIESLTTVYAVTGDAKYLDGAKKAATWITQNRSLGGGGFRHDEKDVAGPYLGDTLAMGRAFLAIYGVTGDRDYLARARQAADFIDEKFNHNVGDKRVGYATSMPASAQLVPQPVRDENVSLARFTNLLHHYSGDPKYRAMAEQAMTYLAARDVAMQIPTAGPLLADIEVTKAPVHVTVVGPKNSPEAKALFAAALKLPDSYRRLEWWDKSEGAMPNADVQYPELKKPAAFVCTDRRCSLPLFGPKELRGKVELLAKAP